MSLLHSRDPLLFSTDVVSRVPAFFVLRNA